MKHWGTVLIIFGLLFLALFGLNGCGAGGDNNNGNKSGGTTSDGWKYTVIDSTCNAANGEIHAVLDSQGKLHVSYFDDNHNALKYVTNKSGAWVIVSVDTGNVDVNIPGEQNDIAVDSNGNAYISYDNLDNDIADSDVGALRYATNASGSWNKQDLFPGYVVSSSIAVDNSGKVHIAFYESEIGVHPYNAKYTNNISGSWLSPEIAGNMAWDGTGICLALGGSSTPYIAYTHSGYGTLNLAVRSGPGSWNSQIIAGNTTGSTDEDAMYPALAIDSSTGQYIVFYNSYSDTLELSVNSAAPLVLASNVSNSTALIAPSITFDSGHKAHIIYCGYSNGSLFLHHVTNKSGSWVDTPLTIQTDSGKSAIVVDSTGMVYIVYADSQSNLCVAAKQLN